jgi:serine/threonine protein kinase/tetratricopeptide (TPR) repeat protein
MGPANSIPKQLGDFEILHELGRGGMGVVYKARQLSLNRVVALKVLSSGLGLTAKAVLRFRREAEAAAKLHHTNIVPIYATGEDNGVHFYAMELIDGPSLDQVIRHVRGGGDSTPAEGDLASTADHESSEPIPDWVGDTIAFEGPRKMVTSTQANASATSSLSGSGIASGTKYFDAVATMIADVADALNHAHDHGVIHRDIKPSNLLLGSDGRLSVNDFGLARVLEQPGMTMSGEFVGTPRYMSPEQITAGRAPLDHRTDIYSLGASLYELLTLAPPFPGKTRDEVIGQILHKEPKPPRRLNRRIPTDLETICTKAIERDPDRRYQTAGQMASDLRAYVNRFAISAKRTGVLGRVHKWIRRHPAISANLLIIVLISGLAAWLGYRNHVSNLQFAKMAKEKEQRLRETKIRNEKERALSAAIAGNFEGAKTNVEHLVQLGASPGWIHMLNGQIALCQGEYKTALSDLRLARQLLGDDLSALALLTKCCMDSGDEISYYVHVSELRRRSAETYNEHVFKGWALTWGFPDEAIVELELAHQQNKSSLLVQALRSYARCWNAVDEASLDGARQAKKESTALSVTMPDSPLPVTVSILSTIIEANLLRERGQETEAEMVLASLDVDDVEPNLRKHIDVRWARSQYFLRTGQGHRIKDEINAAPLEKSGVYLALLGAAELYRERDLEEAMKLYELGAGLGRESQYRFARAFIRMDTDNHREILADFQASLSSRETSIYLLFDCIVLKLLGDREGAEQLGRRLLNMGRERELGQAWITLFEFAAGECGAQELKAVLGLSRRVDCGVYWALATDALARGMRDEANEYFKKVEGTGYFAFYDYVWSLAFSERIESGEPWLSWIPNGNPIDTATEGSQR